MLIRLLKQSKLNQINANTQKSIPNWYVKAEQPLRIH